MKIYGYTTVPPVAGRMAGAVVYFHQVAKRFVQLGHEVTIQVKPKRGNFKDMNLDGVKYKRMVYPVNPDLFLFHSASLESNPNIAQLKAPVFYILHSHSMAIKKDLVRLTSKDYLIANSRNMMETVTWVKTNHRLLYPIADEKYWEPLNGPHNAYTCIGSSVVKNLSLFYNLAIRDPSSSFLHVKGGYGNDNKKVVLPNMHIISNTMDLRDAYQKTKVLIAPSFSETYSLVAREAGLQGIPVVCSNLPGFRENLGDAGLYANPHNVASFEKQLDKLKNPTFYKERSQMIREHCISAEKENLTRLDRFITSFEKNHQI